MKTLILKKAWTYRTPLVTVEYSTGAHEVTDATHAAAIEDGATEGTTDGNGSAKTGATSTACQSKG